MRQLLATMTFGLSGMLLASADPAIAEIGDGTTQCATASRFEPGPIVRGHQRQPTPREFEERVQALQEQAKQRSLLGCDAER
jgi:hypothetical protein